MTKTAAESIALLRAAIQASGLSISAYARDVLVRDPRTVRRWLAGGSIPQAVLAKLGRPSVTVGQQEDR